MEARILKVNTSQALGHFTPGPDGAQSLDSWEVATEPEGTISLLRDVAAYLRKSDVPVAFPTETVYGLGADATRSGAVKGIYTAKGRPSDNPLIVHVSDLTMLRELLAPRSDSLSAEGERTNGTSGTINGTGSTNGVTTNGSHAAAAATEDDLIPAIYRPLIARFWPGPLTILLPNPQPSHLAPEVTAGLANFGARMPASALARSLIGLTGRPLAAPSANASTRPSPTKAAHVADDLEGRIELILDGGACGVGVESTVVDGLCEPPVVLRPGGVSMEELRAVKGWEGVTKAYKDRMEVGGDAPRAPGMKYKHYSPRARVVLYEAGYKGEGGEGVPGLEEEDIRSARSVTGQTIGVIRTQRWPTAGGLQCTNLHRPIDGMESEVGAINGCTSLPSITYSLLEGDLLGPDGEWKVATILDLDLGRDMKGIAHGLFSALRELDRRGADVIFVEGVGDRDDIAAAVMNRLRKAASDIRS